MSASSDASRLISTLANKLEITPDTIVQEIGWDEDCDSSISEAIEDIIGAQLLEEASYEVCDAVLFWWREGDGDLTDNLVDVSSPLDDGGVIWLATPKTGNADAVDPAEIAESAQTAGLSQTSSVTVGNWTINRLLQGRQFGPRR